MRKKRAAKKRNSFLLRLAVVALAVFVIASATSISIQLNELKERVDETNQKTAMQNEKNADLEKQCANQDQYKEKEAYKQGMARPDETIFIEISSD